MAVLPGVQTENSTVGEKRQKHKKAQGISLVAACCFRHGWDDEIHTRKARWVTDPWVCRLVRHQNTPQPYNMTHDFTTLENHSGNFTWQLNWGGTVMSTVTEKGNSTIWCLSEPVSSACCKLLFLLPFHLKITGVSHASAFNKGQCKYIITIICMFKSGARPNVSHQNYK